MAYLKFLKKFRTAIHFLMLQTFPLLVQTSHIQTFKVDNFQRKLNSPDVHSHLTLALALRQCILAARPELLSRLSKTLLDVADGGVPPDLDSLIFYLVQTDSDDNCFQKQSIPPKDEVSSVKV